MEVSNLGKRGDCCNIAWTFTIYLHDCLETSITVRRLFNLIRVNLSIGLLGLINLYSNHADYLAFLIFTAHVDSDGALELLKKVLWDWLKEQSK